MKVSLFEISKKKKWIRSRYSNFLDVPVYIYIYILCLEGHDDHSAIFCECSCMHLFLIFGFFTFLCLHSLGIISFIQKKKVKLEISIFPIAGTVERVYNGRFCGMLGTAACWMIMVFVGGGDQKRSLVGCLRCQVAGTTNQRWSVWYVWLGTHHSQPEPSVRGKPRPAWVHSSLTSHHSLLL